MKIAVVGCGAVGSYYGAKLWKAGQTVHFLLRSDYDTVRKNGVRIRSFEGDFTARPVCASRPEEIGASDLVVVALKTTANDQFPRLLPPLVGPTTAVITLQNGLGNDEHLARLFPAKQILGGHCFVCLNRIEPGVVRHTDHGQIVIGEYRRRSQPRTQQMAGLFRAAGVRCGITEDLALAHWEKLVWNIPFNGLGVAATAGYKALATEGATLHTQPTPEACLPTDRLLADPRWEKLIRELMMEVIVTAAALGFVIPESFADKQIEYTRTMGAYKASTLLDFERGLPLELESLFLRPLREAQQACVRVPRLEALCRVLQQLDPAVARV